MRHNQDETHAQHDHGQWREEWNWGTRGAELVVGIGSSRNFDTVVESIAIRIGHRRTRARIIHVDESSRIGLDAVPQRVLVAIDAHPLAGTWGYGRKRKRLG